MRGTCAGIQWLRLRHWHGQSRIESRYTSNRRNEIRIKQVFLEIGQAVVVRWVTVGTKLLHSGQLASSSASLHGSTCLSCVLALLFFLFVLGFCFVFHLIRRASGTRCRCVFWCVSHLFSVDGVLTSGLQLGLHATRIINTASRYCRFLAVVILCLRCLRRSRRCLEQTSRRTE